MPAGLFLRETRMSSDPARRMLRLIWLATSLTAMLGLQHGALGATQSSSGDSPEWRTVVSKFAQEHFKNPAWGYSHCLRDYRLARELASADHVALDDDVLYAAAYLHDMAAFEP